MPSRPEIGHRLLAALLARGLKVSPTKACQRPPMAPPVASTTRFQRGRCSSRPGCGRRGEVLWSKARLRYSALEFSKPAQVGLPLVERAAGEQRVGVLKYSGAIRLTG
jgi:hypothetical protein